MKRLILLIVCAIGFTLMAQEYGVKLGAVSTVGGVKYCKTTLYKFVPDTLLEKEPLSYQHVDSLYASAKLRLATLKTEVSTLSTAVADTSVTYAKLSARATALANTLSNYKDAKDQVVMWKLVRDSLSKYKLP